MSPVEPLESRAVKAAPEFATTVVVPTYNEAENLLPAVEGALDVLGDVEVIIVDDDSPDGTWQIAADAYASDPRVEVVRRTDDRGLATAVRRGFQEATGDVLLVMDADLQHPPGALAPLLEAVNGGADVAVGSRYVGDGGVDGWPRFRRVVSRGARWLARLAVPDARGLTDATSGLFAVRRSVVEDADLEPRGYKILLDVLESGDPHAVVEVPYTFRARENGESKLGLSEYRAYLEHLFMLRWRHHSLERVASPERAVRMVEFAAIGGLGVLANFGVFVAAMAGGAHYLLAGLFAFTAAVNSNFAGNWLVTFDRPSGSLPRQYVKFHVVSIAGFVVYMLSLMGLVELAAAPVLFGNLGAVAASASWNYLGSEQVAFA